MKAQNRESASATSDLPAPSRHGVSSSAKVDPNQGSAAAHRIAESKWLLWGWMAIAVIVFSTVIGIRIRLLGVPLERDEGEYAYMGQLMLQGIGPYKLAYSMKFPGVAAAYAAIMLLFGQSISAIHFGLLLVNVATAGLVGILAYRLMNITAAIAAATCYAVLSLSLSVTGLAAHATQFVVLPVTAGLVLLLSASNRKTWLFLSGFLLGIGVLMKQPAVVFILFGLGFQVFRDARIGIRPANIVGRSIVLSCGAALPFVITCLAVWHAGSFAKFWFWTVEYAHEYVSRISWSEGARIFAHQTGEVCSGDWPLWTLAGLGLLIQSWDKQHRDKSIFLVGLFLFSFFAICPSFYFRNHYFVLALPAVALLAGSAITKLSELRGGLLKLIGLLVFAAGLAWPIARNGHTFFVQSPRDVSLRMYPNNPFTEAIEIADYLRQHTAAEDRIAVMGSEPEIYFYAHRHSATGYIYTYGLMEEQRYSIQMQREMAHEVQLAQPKYLIFIGVDFSWSMASDSRRSIFDWIGHYAQQYYEPVGYMTFPGSGHTQVFWDKLPTSVPPLDSYIVTYRRR